MHMFWEESWGKCMKHSEAPQKLLWCHVNLFTVLLSICLCAFAFFCTLEIYLTFISTSDILLSTQNYLCSSFSKEKSWQKHTNFDHRTAFPPPNCELLCAVRRSKVIPCKHNFLKIVFADWAEFLYVLSFMLFGLHSSVQSPFLWSSHWLSVRFPFSFFNSVNWFCLWKRHPR